MLVAGVDRRSCCRIDNHPLFPEFCSKSEKWFRRAAELFRGSGPDETKFKKDQCFQSNAGKTATQLSFIGPAEIRSLAQAALQRSERRQRRSAIGEGAKATGGFEASDILTFLWRRSPSGGSTTLAEATGQTCNFSGQLRVVL